MPRPHAVAAILLVTALSAASAAAETLRITPDRAGKIWTVEIVDAPLSRVLDAWAMRLAKPIRLDATDRRVSFRDTRSDLGASLEALTRDLGLTLVRGDDHWRVRETGEPTLTLDVKDADVHAILAEIKAQCGIRNLMVDRNVGGKGTFRFEDVPCSDGMRVIFRSLGLAAESYPSSVVRVSR